jgi:hypothetical protein
VNEFQALAANLNRVAVYLAVFAATAVLILAAMAVLFYFLGLLDLLRGGFLYAQRARLGRADPLRYLGKPVPDVHPGAFGAPPSELPSPSQAGHRVTVAR